MWQPRSLPGCPAPPTALGGAEPSSSGLAGAASAKGAIGRRGQKLIENNYGPDWKLSSKFLVTSWGSTGSSQYRGKRGGYVSTMVKCLSDDETHILRVKT